MNIMNIFKKKTDKSPPQVIVHAYPGGMEVDLKSFFSARKGMKEDIERLARTMDSSEREKTLRKIF